MAQIYEDPFEDAKIAELQAAYDRLVQVAEDYRTAIRANLERQQAGTWPNRPQRLNMMAAHVKHCDELIHTLETDLLTRLIEIVDRAGGPWNRKQFTVEV